MSDAVGLDNIAFSPGALVGSLLDRWQTGTPTLISHDWGRPVGWTYPECIHFQPQLSRLVGVQVIAESAREIERVNNDFLSLQERRMLTEREEGLETLRSILGDHLIGPARSTCSEAIALSQADLAVRVAPDLFAEHVVNKDGLTPLRLLDAIAPGVYLKGEVLLFASRHLRRSSNELNSLNTAFLEKLQGLDAQAFNPHIALDRDMVGLASSFEGHILERSYWWGPEFSDDLGSIRTGLHFREATDRERFYHQISGTELWWYSRQGFHNFEAEELKDAPLPSSGEYVCRYVHAMVPESTGLPSHFDGAVRIYTPEEMIVRLDKKIDKAGRNTEYHKLWRIDGTIPVITWKELLTDYFRDNPLVGGYLGAKEKLEATDGDVPAQEPDPTSALVPYTFGSGGCQTACSIISPVGAAAYEMLPLDLLRGEDGDSPIIGKEAIHFAKYLLRKSVPVTLPKGALIDDAQDRYYDYGCLSCPPGSVLEVIRLLREFTEARTEREEHHVLSFAIRIPSDDHDCVWSFMGNAAEVIQMLADDSNLPAEFGRESLIQWSDGFANAISKIDGSGPQLFEVLRRDGTLRPKRKIIDEARWQVVPIDDTLALRVAPNEIESQVLASSTRPIEAVLGFTVRGFVCGKCQKDYLACLCVQPIDEGVPLKADRVIARYAFWTDLPGKDFIFQ